jgi:hypothetical protein
MIAALADESTGLTAPANPGKAADICVAVASDRRLLRVSPIRACDAL